MLKCFTDPANPEIYQAIYIVPQRSSISAVSAGAMHCSCYKYCQTPSVPMPSVAFQANEVLWSKQRGPAVNRIHGFEFNDQGWLPQSMTSWKTSVLHVSYRQTEDGRVWAPKIIELMDRYNLMSCLRTYSANELRVFTSKLSAYDYHWEVGELYNPVLDMPCPYIMGYPDTGSGQRS